MIYFIQAEGVGHVKIGFTDADDADVRLATLQIGSPVPLRLLGTVQGSADEEKDFHQWVNSRGNQLHDPNPAVRQKAARELDQFGSAARTAPSTSTGDPLVDAFFWVKPPGESDGTCNGGPKAGEFWTDAGVGLAKSAKW